MSFSYMASTENGAGSAPAGVMPSSDPKNLGSDAMNVLKGDSVTSETSMNSSGAAPTDGNSKPENSDAPRAWPTSLPPLPPHMAGADLPIANISRIMKRALPDNGKIAKNAKECMQECVSELISFITSEASDRCGSEKRKTINGDDILYSLRVLGFDNYEQVLKVYLSRYRQAQEENPRQRRRRAGKRRSSPSSLHDGTGTDGDMSTVDGAQADDDGQDDDDDDDADDDVDDE